MNLKPSPLTEASAVLGIAILGVLLTFALSSSNIEVGFVMLSNSAITFLLPAFTFWAVIGLFVRGKSKAFRMLTNIAISALVTSVLSSLFISSVGDSTTGTLQDRQNAQAVVAGMSLVTFFSCLVGALATYLWLLRAERAK
jgi:F0F1-type ATP synthase membrane subunit a